MPTELGGCVAWGEASDLGNDGSAVSAWFNRIGSGLDPVQATSANQPVVKVAGVNGQKAVLFDGSNDFLGFPSGALGWFQNLAGATLAMVCQPTSVASTAWVLNAQPNGALTPTRAGLVVVSGPTYGARGLNTDTGTAATATGGVPVVGTAAIVTGQLDYAGGTLALRVNGASAGTATFSGANSANTLSGAITLGARSDASSPFSGYLAAYAMWTVAYGRASMDAVLNRWSALYGIPLAG